MKSAHGKGRVFFAHPCAMDHIYPLGDSMIMKAVRVSLCRDWTDQWHWIQRYPTWSWPHEIPWHARLCQEFSARYWWKCARYMPGTCKVKLKQGTKALKKIESRQNLGQSWVSRCLKNLCELPNIANMSREVTRPVQMQLPNCMMDEYDDLCVVFSIEHVFWR